MEREQAAPEYEDLKKHFLPNDQLPRIDLTGAVMNRITAIQAGKRRRFNKPRQRLSIYAAGFFLLLLASASVYAASDIIEIRNRAGEVIIQSIIRKSPSPINPSTREDSKVNPSYRDRVLEMVKPGQLLAYSIRDGRSPSSIQYLYDTRVHSYNDFEELLTRTSAPVIKEPTALPAGFSFDYGSVAPLFPHEQDERTSAEYERLLFQLQKRAAAEPNQDLLVEEVHWTNAEGAELEYRRGEATLRITAAKNAVRVEETLSSGFSQEKWIRGGKDILLAHRQSGNENDYVAIWYDEAEATHYDVSAMGVDGLTESQFKLVIEDLAEK
ncbi:hypothetical protein [Gorillibacterium timonense]|uniref:hypothetical protein n=1 Tax=Gorillibacterium timonense TaxID=1689269 RepID=UPI00071CF5AB|nr:hypothetical protein [Gorillibacterium timonense]